MDATNAFIDALETWNQTTPVVQDFYTLLAVLSIKIGEINPFSKDHLTDLKNRINHLVTVEKIDEGFLIDSLISSVTTLLEDNRLRHGDRLLFEERMTTKLGKDSPLNEQLEKKRDPSYFYWVTRELDNWHRIVATKLGIRQRLEWEQKRQLDIMSRQPKLTDIPVPLRDIPLGKLIERASLEDIQHMSEMDAFRLRKDINTEDK